MEFAARDYFLALQFFQKEEQDLIWGKSLSLTQLLQAAETK